MLSENALNSSSKYGKLCQIWKHDTAVFHLFHATTITVFFAISPNRYCDRRSCKMAFKGVNFCSNSTCEAEYIAISLAEKESIWLSRLLQDLTNSWNLHTICLRIDNNGAIATSMNCSNTQRRKHNHFRFHFVWDFVQTNKFKLRRCDSKNQLADSFTKTLDRFSYEKHRLLQGIQDLLL